MFFHTISAILHLKTPLFVEKSQGRLQTRCLKASTSLNDYLDWPGIAQVFQYRYTDKNPTQQKKHTKSTMG